MGASRNPATALHNSYEYADPYGLLTLDDVAFLTPERASSAAQYWAVKHNQTGNWGYAIPGMAAALLAEHYDSVMMAMCSADGLGTLPWSARSVREAAKALEAGATEVRMASRSQAEELFLGRYQGYGYRNVSSMAPRESKEMFGTKAEAITGILAEKRILMEKIILKFILTKVVL